MDHLLRNRRLGFARTPVSNPFFIDHLVYFLHRRNAHNLTHPRIQEHSKWTKFRAILSTSKTALLWECQRSNHRPSPSFYFTRGCYQDSPNCRQSIRRDLHTDSYRFWRRTAILGMVIALVAPSYAMFCFIPLLVGIFSLVFQTDIGFSKQVIQKGKRS